LLANDLHLSEAPLIAVFVVLRLSSSLGTMDAFPCNKVARDVKLTIHLILMRRLRVELYLHSRRRLHGLYSEDILPFKF
jgi:hypothetical protein